MTILGIDAGNHDIKVVGPEGAIKFPSYLAKWREIRLDNERGRYHMEVEHRGQQYLAGDLAVDQGMLATSLKGVTKANEEILIRVLLALAQYDAESVHEIVVGQPIKTHTKDEKEKIVKMLEGPHDITVNGKTRAFSIKKVAVAAEGAAVGLLEPLKARYHIIDVGSGTINWATVGSDGKQVKFYDVESDTETRGLSTLGDQVEMQEVANFIGQKLSARWGDMDVVRIVGAAADDMLNPMKRYFPNAEVYRPAVHVKKEAGISLERLEPVYANAAAFYAIARSLYGKKK